MSSPPHHSRPPIPVSVSSSTSPSPRPADGCAISTHSPLPSPTTCSGSAPAPWPGTADQCAANTPKHSPVLPFMTRLPSKCSPGSKLRSSSQRTNVYVRSAVAGTPVAGPVRYVSHHFSHLHLPFPSGGNLSRHGTSSLFAKTHPPTTQSSFSRINHSFIRTQMTWIRGPQRSRSTRYSIISTSQLARSSTPQPCFTRYSRRTRIVGERFMRRSVAMRALRAHS